MLSNETKKELLKAQRSEITEHFVYKKLAEKVKDSHNRKILLHISNDELRHHNFWKKYTEQEVKPKKFLILWFYLVSRIFGFTFGVRLMEKGEKKAQVNYKKISKFIPGAKRIEKDEHKHENQLLSMLDEERLKYVGSVVLGLNDALVELTGALAGFTLALRNTNLIAVTGLIIGFAASLSMGASEYLSTKTDANGKSPLKASVYTGFAYVMTVVLLIFPYFLFENVYFCLGFALFNALLVILFFTFYISIAKDLSFKKRFGEMALISLGVAAISFGVGYLIKSVIGIEI